MKIGIDLRVLQIGHQYRGIGEVAKRTLNEIFKHAVADGGHSFVFYHYDHPASDPKRLLDIPQGLEFSEVNLGVEPLKKQGRSLANKVITKYRTLYGNPLPAAHGLDVFVQFDYVLGIPKRVRTILIKHDLIPYIFWQDYFTSPWVHFRNRAARTTIRQAVHNYEYKRVLRRSLSTAYRIVCVSEHTKRDLKHYFGVPERKLLVNQLGVSEKALTAGDTPAVPDTKLPTKPFLLFVGAGDARRRVGDLVSAFNNLKADGHDIQLVLAGENFPSPEKIPNANLRHEVMDSSYIDDILCLGYVDDATRNRLYSQAIAFVFPTLYEGFGIPILEAMLARCPVITYRNSSIPEVGADHVLYAKDWSTLYDRVIELNSLSVSKRSEWIGAAEAHARQFSWEKTGQRMYEIITKKQ